MSVDSKNKMPIYLIETKDDLAKVPPEHQAELASDLFDALSKFVTVRIRFQPNGLSENEIRLDAAKTFKSIIEAMHNHNKATEEK